MKLLIENCDGCGLDWPAEDVRDLSSACGRYELALCLLCDNNIPSLSDYYVEDYRNA
jgi:hypothetical protein